MTTCRQSRTQYTRVCGKRMPFVFYFRLGHVCKTKLVRVCNHVKSRLFLPFHFYKKTYMYLFERLRYKIRQLKSCLHLHSYVHLKKCLRFRSQPGLCTCIAFACKLQTRNFPCNFNCILLMNIMTEIVTLYICAFLMIFSSLDFRALFSSKIAKQL